MTILFFYPKKESRTPVSTVENGTTSLVVASYSSIQNVVSEPRDGGSFDEAFAEDLP